MEKVIAKTYATGVIPTSSGLISQRCMVLEKWWYAVWYEATKLLDLLSMTQILVLKYIRTCYRTGKLSLPDEDGEFPAYFQQDGAPLHYGICVVKVRPAILGLLDWPPWSREWPKTSPGLSPTDLYLCGHSKAMVYREKTRNTNRLKECIRNVISPWTAETVCVFKIMATT
jgi:hypothetical protein